MNESTIPAAACVFQAEIDVKERKGSEDRSTPFTGIARTGDALTHPYWGAIVHDLSGMRVKDRIPIDWNHSDVIVGYANRFNTESGDLEIKGALTPTKYDQTQRAQQIIDQSEQGVPFELSISFPGDLTLEQIEENEEVEVNNRTFTGPLTVVRSWPLRAVAVTPLGQDAETSLQFSGEEVVNVTYIKRSEEMPKEELTAVEAEVENTTDAVEEAQEDTVEAQAVDTDEVQEETVEEAVELSAPTAQDYMDQFGRVQGALYFADGLSMVDALKADNKRLQKELSEAQERNADGEPDATGFSQGGEMKSNVLTAIPGEVYERPKVRSI